MSVRSSSKHSATKPDKPDIVLRYTAFLSGWGKWSVIGAWTVVCILGAVFAPKFLQATTMAFTAPADTPSAKARVQLNHYFPVGAKAQPIVVFAQSAHSLADNDEVRIPPAHAF